METRLLLCDTHALFTVHKRPSSSSSSSSSVSSRSIEALALAMACGIRPRSLAQKLSLQQRQHSTLVVLQGLSPSHAQLAAWLQSLVPLSRLPFLCPLCFRYLFS